MIGFINVNKPSGMTSNAVVQKIKKRFHIKKIGHMGTLDPLASGVLPIAIGKATRLFDYSLNKSKRYTAVFDFGYSTDTLDITGEKVNDGAYVPTSEEIMSVLPKLTGKISQIPPHYSAKNINGVRAYDLARRGIDFELKPKDVIIHNIELIEKVSEYQYKFDIVCSSGTYIRAICRDLATMLDTYACMSALIRTETGVFNLTSSINLEDIIDSKESINKYLIPPIDAFPQFDRVTIDSNVFNDLLNGKRPKWKKLQNDTFVIFDNQLVGIAKKDSEELILETFLFETKE
jgi:tRNA pseudouridine55 synthase